MGNNKDITNYALLGFAMVLLVVFALPASAGINFNYTNVTPRNYTITDNVLESENFVRLVGGNIEMPSVLLSFSIDNTTLVSGDRSLNLNSTKFGPKTTDLPAQKVYIVGSPGGIATVQFYVDASSTYFHDASVNISTYKQISNTVPFFSDLSVALLDFDDLKNKWSNKSIVLDELANTASDQNKIYETNVILNSAGDSDQISQTLLAGNYLILVTKGTDPKEIISFTIVRVMPFSSTISVPSTGTVDSDINVGITLSSALSESYTYITSIINRTDYSDNIGNVNITWTGSQNLSQATRINGTVLANANTLTDIIPRSNTTRTTINSNSATLTLKTGTLPAGSYLVHTLVLNSSNQTVVFNQSSFTLTPTDITAPSLVVNQPTNGQVFNTSSITVSGTASDASGIASVTVNGAAATGTTTWSKIITLTPGTNTITVVATDNTGNTATVTRTVTYTPAVIDTTPPVLTVEQPIDGQIFGVSSITVSGTASDASGIASVTVNGAAANGTTTWSKIITLTPGTNTITVVATDDAGNTKTETRNVTYTPEVVDTTPPSLVVDQPTNGQDFNTSSITVSGTASDASGISSVTVNGAAATGIINWSKIITLTPGTNTITVVATDGAGNTATVTLTVTYTPTTAIQVSIEINPKTINPNSSGEIKVTIFNNTPPGFDVASIIISTVRFGPNGALAVRNETPTNKLIIHFNTQDTGIKCGDTQASLTGKKSSGQDIFGSDSIRTTECTIRFPLPLDAANRTNTTLNFTSPSGNTTITIPNGTSAEDINGNPLTNISIDSTPSLPANASVALMSGDRVVGDNVNLGPEGARFDPTIQIRFNYSLPLPSGVNENSLTVRFFNSSTNSWEVMQTVERNTAQHYIIANISHFSTFALIGTAISTGSRGGSSSGGYYATPTAPTTEPTAVPTAAPTAVPTATPVSTSVPEKETVTPQETTTTYGWLAALTGFFLPTTEDIVKSWWIYALFALVVIAVAVRIYIAKKKGGK